jgi:hypothetical protein
MSPATARRPISVHRPPADAYVLLTRDGEEVARWPILFRCRPDLSLVDELARLQLAAGRVGCRITVAHGDDADDLLALLELVGLADVLRQVRGEPEDLEQVGVEEVVVPDDPAT